MSSSLTRAMKRPHRSKMEIAAAVDPVGIANAVEQASAPGPCDGANAGPVVQHIVADEALPGLHPRLEDQRIAARTDSSVATARRVAGSSRQTTLRLRAVKRMPRRARRGSREKHGADVLGTDPSVRLDAFRDGHRLRMRQRLDEPRIGIAQADIGDLRIEQPVDAALARPGACNGAASRAPSVRAP